MDFMNFVVQERINERKNNEKINLTELIKKMPQQLRKITPTRIMVILLLLK